MTDENVVSGEELDAVASDPVVSSPAGDAESGSGVEVDASASAGAGDAPGEAVEAAAEEVASEVAAEEPVAEAPAPEVVEESPAEEPVAEAETEESVAEEELVEEAVAEAGSDEDEDEEEDLGPISDEPVNEFGFTASEMVGDDDDDEEVEDEDENASPIEEFVEEVAPVDNELEMDWYILKVQVNRERGICEALQRRVKQQGLGGFFGDILVPTEDVREFNKSGKQRVVKRKLYPGYVVVRMAINDDTWFLVRETPGIGDFTGAVGKPAALSQAEIDRIIATTRPAEVEEGDDAAIKTSIKFKVGDRVRVKEGYFQNHEGEISKVDERNGRVEAMINIFGRPNPVELDHWQVEDL